MANLTINIPDELLEDLQDISEQLKTSPSETVLLALSYIMQQNTLENAIEGIARIDDDAEDEIISFPELKDEFDLDINFQATAMQELEALDEEEQIDLIAQLIERLSIDEDEIEEDDNVDLVLRDDDDASIILSCFDFGDIVYRLSNEDVTVYHIAINEMLEDEDFDEELEDAFDEDFVEETIDQED